MPKTVLVITSSPKNPELLDACQYLEATNFKIWIELPESSLTKDDWFSWFILDLKDKNKESVNLSQLLNLVNCDRIMIICNSFSLMNDLKDYDVYSSWSNLIERNFFT